MTNRISVLIDISYILVTFDFLPYLFMHTYNLYIIPKLMWYEKFGNIPVSAHNRLGNM